MGFGTPDTCLRHLQRVTGIERGLVCIPPSAPLAHTNTRPRNAGKSSSPSGRFTTQHVPPSQRWVAGYAEALAFGASSFANSAIGGGRSFTSIGTTSSRRKAFPAGSFGSKSGPFVPKEGTGGGRTRGPVNISWIDAFGPPSHPAVRTTTPASASARNKVAPRTPLCPENVPALARTPRLRHGTSTVLSAFVSIASGIDCRSAGAEAPGTGETHAIVTVPRQRATPAISLQRCQGGHRIALHPGSRPASSPPSRAPASRPASKPESIVPESTPASAAEPASTPASGVTPASEPASSSGTPASMPSPGAHVQPARRHSTQAKRRARIGWHHTPARGLSVRDSRSTGRTVFSDLLPRGQSLQRPTPAGVCAFTTSGGFVGLFFAPAMCGHDAAFPAPIDAS